MPHSHSKTEAATRRIEDTVEQLLRRGQEIFLTLKKEMNYVGKLHRGRVSCSRSTSKATGQGKSQVSCTETTVVVSSFSDLRRDEEPTSSVKSHNKPVSPSEKSQSSRSYSTFTKKKQKVFSSGQEKGPSVNPTSCEGELSRSQKSEEVIKVPSIISDYCFDYVPVQKETESRYCFEEKLEASSFKPKKRQSRVKKPVGQEKGQSTSSNQKSCSCTISKPICRLPVKLSSCFPRIPAKETKIEMTSFPVDPVQDYLFKGYPHRTRIYQNKTTYGPDEILTRVYSPNNLNSKWIRVNGIWTSQGDEKLSLWLDLLGEEYRNVWINGKQIDV